MSSDVTIALDGVGKRYQLGISSGIGLKRTKNERTTMAEAMIHRVRHPTTRRTTNTSEFWALRDISFELHEGDVLGLLGRNGAGKTTLLKLLTRITSITEGRIDLYGRVGSLLEVGTGFNPELTGRENIHLNGAILGMRRSEIERQLDAIVDFSGVENFLNTPVKRYSTGMAVRLAFAIAAHLRTGILLVDEVLSVGDQAFREKCLGKLGDVAGDGRTVIYVSHLMETVTSLCTEAVLLESGQLKMHGGVQEVVTAYIDRKSEVTDLMENIDQRHGDGTYRLVEVTPTENVFDGDQDKTIEFAIERRGNAYKYNFAVVANFIDARENTVANIDSRLVREEFEPADHHRGRLTLRTPWLKPGRYRVDMALMRPGGFIDDVPGACFIEVTEKPPYPGVIGQHVNRANHSTTLADFSIEQFDGASEKPRRSRASHNGTGNGNGISSDEPAGTSRASAVPGS